MNFMDQSHYSLLCLKRELTRDTMRLQQPIGSCELSIERLDVRASSRFSSSILAPDRAYNVGFTLVTHTTGDIEYPKKVMHCCPSLTEKTRISLILHAPLQRMTMPVDSPLKKLLQASRSLARDILHQNDTNTFYHHSIQRDDLVPLLMTLARSRS